MWYVYIIKSEEGLIYTGITKDITRRILEHNERKSTWTKRGSNWKLVHSESYPSVKQARVREKYFKNNSGKEWLKRRGLI